MGFHKTMEWIRPKTINFYKFIKILRVEPFLFLVAFQGGLKGAPGGQFNVDKICMHWYNTSGNYCHDLPNTKEDDSGPGHFKSTILGDAAQFGTYGLYINTPLCIIWALFLGAWIDRYVKARKLLLVMFCISGILENIMAIYFSISWNTSIYYNLLTHIPGALLGGGGMSVGPRIAITHYITSSTPPKLLAIRFMIFETVMSLGGPIGGSLGGYILVQKPVFHTGEIRNYTILYTIALAFELLALLWIAFMVKERVARKHELKVEMKIRASKRVTDTEEDTKNIKLKTDMIQADKDVHPLRLLFDLGNLKAMMKTLTKNRSNKARLQIFLLIISIAIKIGEGTGWDNISHHFIQKVYLWGPDWSAYMSSITSLLTSFCTMAFIPVMIKVFKVKDVRLALFSYCIITMQNIIRGCWLSENAYYLAMAIGAFSGIASICSKSHIAKLVDRDELGKLLSLMTTLLTISPLLFTPLFAYIFKYSIDTYPGAVNQVMAVLLLFPVFVMMWIDLYTKTPLIEGDDSQNEKSHHDKNENVIEKDFSLNAQEYINEPIYANLNNQPKINSTRM